MALKELEIVGKFSVDGILRGLGQTISAVDKAKLEFQSLQTGVQSNLNTIGQKVVDLSKKQQQSIKDLSAAKKELNAIKPNLDGELVSRELAKDKIAAIKSQLSLVKEQQREAKALLSIETQQGNMKLKMAKAQLQEQIAIERQMEKVAKQSGGGLMSSIGNATQKGLGASSVGMGMRGILATGAVGAGVYAAGRIAAKAVMDDIALDREMIQVNNAVVAKDPTTRQFLKNQVLASSTASGMDATEVARQYAQLLSSVQFAPKGAPGSQEYMDGIRKAGEVSARMTMSAKATGANSKDYMDAATYTAQAYGVDMTDTKNAERVFDIMAYTQRKGKGTMGEYAKEFQKFMPSAKDVGWKMDEAAMLFANMTNKYDPAMAGTSVTHYEKLFQQPAQLQSYVSGRMSTLGKKGLIPGTADDKKILEGLTGKGISNMFYDSDHKARGLLDTTKRINDVYKSLKGEDAKSFFLTMMSKNDSLALKSLQMLTGDSGLTDDSGNKMKGFNVVDDMIRDGANAIAGSNDNNIANLTDSISYKWDHMTQTWKNGMIGFANNAEGGIGDIIGILTTLGEQLPKIGQKYQDFATIMEHIGDTVYNIAHPEEPLVPKGEVKALGYIPKRDFPFQGVPADGLWSGGSGEVGEMQKKLEKLAREGNGEGSTFYSGLENKSLWDQWNHPKTIVDKIAKGNEDIPKDDFIHFFGNKSTEAAKVISDSVTNHQKNFGAVDALNGLFGTDTALNQETYKKSTMQIGEEYLGEQNQLLIVSNSHQEEMVRQLQTIAGKNFGVNWGAGDFLSGLIHPSTTGTKGSGTPPSAVQNSTKK